MKKIIFFLSFILVLTKSFSQVYFSENFNTGFAQGWSSIDNDGDGFDWKFTDLTGFGSTIDAQAFVAFSESFDVTTGTNLPLTPDNYFISPSIDLSTAVGQTFFNFKVGTIDQVPFDEFYSVYVVTNSSLINIQATAPIQSQNIISGGVMESYSYDISAFNGSSSVFLVFQHHNCTGQLLLALDDILVSGIQAEFTVDANAGCLNTTAFNFSDLSIGATTWDWNFGAGANPATFSGQNPPAVTYSTSGLKTVSLTIDGGVTETKIDTIFINDPTIDNVPASLDQTLCGNSNSALMDFVGTGSPALDFDWTYTTVPAGQNIGIPAAGTGDIASFLTVNNSAANIVATFTVTPVDGACSGTPINFTMTINPADDASFAYSAPSYCFTDPSPTPVVTGLAGGTFSSVPAGLALDVNTGFIDLSTSLANTYDVTYSTVGACPNSSTVQVSVGAGPSVNPVLPFAICEGSATADIIFSGSPGSTFSWTNTDATIGIPTSGNGNILSFISMNGTLNPITATIDVTPSVGTCFGVPISFTITVNPIDDASFNISTNASCSGDVLNGPIVSLNPSTVAGGVFSAAPAGLTIDSNTGAIDITTSSFGLYSVTYTTSGSCPNSSSLNYELIETPVLAVLPPVSSCPGLVVPTLPASLLSIYTVDWTNDNVNTGISSLSGSGDVPSFTSTNAVLGGPSEVSNITLTATNNGCVSAPVTTTVTIFSNPSVSGGADRTICEGTAITMSGAGTATSYSWDNAITDGVAFTPLAGNYIYTVTGTSNNCTTMDQVNVNVNPKPFVVAGSDKIVCNGSLTTLTGSGAPTLSWDNGVTDNVPFTPFVSGNYILTGVSNNGCSNTDTLVITIENLPVPSFISNVNMGCIPTVVNFTSPNVANAAVYTYNDGTFDLGSNIFHTFTNSGIYDVTLTETSINGCIGSTTFPSMIVINPDPVASFTANETILNMVNSSTKFNNNSIGASTYEWNFGDSTLDNDFEPIHTFPGDIATDYSVRLVAVTDFGCKDTVFLLITIEESVLLYIPNSFTPNGDERNNRFEPLLYAGFDPQQYNLKIFDRFGELIFESNDADEGWDGDYGAGRGLAPTGTYTYKLQFNTADKDEKKVFVGNVNLIR